MRESQKTKFIERVRRYPFLYNQNHMDYNEHFKKDVLWDKIAADFSLLSGGSAKLQWKRMRDKFRDTLKKKIVPVRRRRANLVSEYRFQKQMSFLIPFTAVRRGDTFYVPIDDDELKFVDESFPQNSMSSTSEIDNNFCAGATKSEVQIQGTPWLSQDFQSNRILFDKQQKSKTVSLNNKIQHTAKQCRQKMKAKKFKCKIDDFFRTMCDTAKNLPKLYQLEVQKKIFDIVINAEEHCSLSTFYNDQTKRFKKKLKVTKARDKNSSHVFLDESTNALQCSYLNEDSLDCKKKIKKLDFGDEIDDVGYFKCLLPYVKRLQPLRKMFIRTEFEKIFMAELGIS